jgi:hypothetical protein
MTAPWVLRSTQDNLPIGFQAVAIHMTFVEFLMSLMEPPIIADHPALDLLNTAVKIHATFYAFLRSDAAVLLWLRRQGFLDTEPVPITRKDLAQYDQVRRQKVQFQRLDVSQRADGIQGRDIRHSRMRAHIDDHLFIGELPGTAIVQRDLNGLRADETAATQNQFGTTAALRRLVKFNLSIDHVLLAAAYLAHVGLPRIRHCTEPSGILDEMRDTRAPEFVL